MRNTHKNKRRLQAPSYAAWKELEPPIISTSPISASGLGDLRREAVMAFFFSIMASLNTRREKNQKKRKKGKEKQRKKRCLACPWPWAPARPWLHQSPAAFSCFLAFAASWTPPSAHTPRPSLSFQQRKIMEKKKGRTKNKNKKRQKKGTFSVGLGSCWSRSWCWRWRHTGSHHPPHLPWWRWACPIGTDCAPTCWRSKALTFWFAEWGCRKARGREICCKGPLEASPVRGLWRPFRDLVVIKLIWRFYNKQ